MTPGVLATAVLVGTLVAGMDVGMGAAVQAANPAHSPKRRCLRVMASYYTRRFDIVVNSPRLFDGINQWSKE
jgi:hypothetical protein